jgi:hypothetical protein
LTVQRRIQKDPDVTTIRAHFITLVDDVIDDAGRHAFLWVHPDRVRFVDADTLFDTKDAKVSVAFKEAKADIVSAGGCIAAELPTAAVFHLMRVAEYGLRAVGKKLRVRLKHRGARMPIEYGDWNDVIAAIRGQIAKARTLSRGPKKDAALTFYSDVADQCEYMKDIWRNTISHTRRPYLMNEALAVMSRVEAFMVRLATELRTAKVVR